MTNTATYELDGVRVPCDAFSEYVTTYTDALINIHCDYLGEFEVGQNLRVETLGNQRRVAIGSGEITVSITGDESLRASVEGLAGQYHARGDSADDDFSSIVDDLCYLAGLESTLRERDGVHTLEVSVLCGNGRLDLVTLDGA